MSTSHHDEQRRADHPVAQSPARPPRRRRALTALAATLAAAALALLPTGAAWADPPGAIPANATAGDEKWQPATDYDTDGCYPSVAVAGDGTPAEGLNNSGALNGSCRDQSDLDNANTYVRTSCVADGWCAHVYAYYFEKDQVVAGLDAFGHRHDLEHVIVWIKDDQARYVSASAHGNYDTRAAGDVLWDGTHPKIVYHKDGAGTHAFRFATGGDEPPENHYGTWQRPALLSWELLSDPVRNTINTHSYGSASFDIRDEVFAGKVAQWAPEEAPF